jgi:transcriptional regulator with XRE-family HTH domain
VTVGGEDRGAVIDETLGVALKKLRAAAGMTQEELAYRTGISARTVSDVERGLRTSVHGDTARRRTAAERAGPHEV